MFSPAVKTTSPQLRIDGAIRLAHRADAASAARLALPSLLLWAALAAVLLALIVPAAASAASPPPGFVGLQDWTHPGPAGFARLGRAEARLYRVNLNWSAIDRGGGSYYWDRYDALFDRAAASGVRLMPVLIGSPRWAAPKPQWPPRSASNRRAFRRFTAAAVQRYGPNGQFWKGKPHSSWVRARWWQVWNEPNHRSWWTNRKPNARAYASMLIDISAAAKQTDPAVKILSAGLPQSAVRRSCGSLCISTFLTDVFEVRGAARAIDAVAVHTYSRDTDDVLARLDYARSAMRKFRDARNKHLWITETGWATGGNHPAFTTTYSGQARRLEDSYRKLLRVRYRYNLLGAVWFNLRDPYRSSSWQRNTGLFDWRGRSKPAWRALLKITGGR